MERKVDTEQIEVMALRFIEAARGTCKSEHEIMEEEEINLHSCDEEISFWSFVEDQIFLCTSCNWWCEASEHSILETDEFICEQCLPDEDD